MQLGIGARAAVAACILAWPGVAPAQDDPQRYVMVSVVATHPYWNPFKEGAQDAADELGVEFRYIGPSGFDVGGQVNAFEQAMATQPDGIMAVHSTEALYPSVQKAIDQGTPVIYVAGDGADSPRQSYVGTNDYDVGVIMGEKAVEMLDGEGEVALSTVPAQDNLNQRIQGIEDVFADHPGMEIVATADNKGDDSETATTTTAMLMANPEVDLVIAINATGAGVATALRETGRVEQVDAIVSDTLPPILDAIEQGVIDYTIAQNVYMTGYLGLKLLHDAANPTEQMQRMTEGGINMLPKTINTGVSLIDASQVSLFR